MNGRTFTCAECGWTGPTAWTLEEAEAEQRANGWGDLPAESLAVVCDDCYQKIFAWCPPSDYNRTALGSAELKRGLRANRRLREAARGGWR